MTTLERTNNRASSANVWQKTTAFDRVLMTVLFILALAVAIPSVVSTKEFLRSNASPPKPFELTSRDQITCVKKSIGRKTCGVEFTNANTLGYALDEVHVTLTLKTEQATDVVVKRYWARWDRSETKSIDLPEHTSVQKFTLSGACTQGRIEVEWLDNMFEAVDRSDPKRKLPADAQGQATAGSLSSGGQGVPKEEAQGIEGIKTSAGQGDPEAQCKLGAMYFNGRGVLQDQGKALQWALHAAFHGSSNAQSLVGVIYGLRDDPIRSYAWFTVANANGGHPEAVTGREIVEKALPPEELLEAKQLSAELWEISQTRPAFSSFSTAAAKQSQSIGIPISPELAAWYVRLQQEREALDVSDSQVVARFNSRAAGYQNAVNIAKIRSNAQRGIVAGAIPIEPPRRLNPNALFTVRNRILENILQ